MSLVPTNEDNARAEGEQQGFKRGYQSATVDAKRNDQFNGLSPAEHERLTILFEEMAESIQVVGKTLRHGYASYNPFDPTRETNRSLLETELGHVMYAISALIDAKELEGYKIHDSQKKKAKTILRYLHHAAGDTRWDLEAGDVPQMKWTDGPVKLSRFDTEPTPAFIMKGTLPTTKATGIGYDRERRKLINRSAYQHNWKEAGNSYGEPYSICTKCSLSSTYVNHFLKGDEQLCKVKS